MHYVEFLLLLLCACDIYWENFDIFSSRYRRKYFISRKAHIFFFYTFVFSQTHAMMTSKQKVNEWKNYYVKQTLCCVCNRFKQNLWFLILFIKCVINLPELMKKGILNLPDNTLSRNDCNVDPSKGNAPQTRTYKTTPSD